MKTKNNQEFYLQSNRGFTLIELLIVVAIIGILAGAILVSTNGAKTKSQLAAFKNTTKGSVAGLTTSCITTGTAIALPNDDVNTNWAGAYTTPCTSNGRFTITATPVNTAIDCIATVNENGVTYLTSGGLAC